jgi:cytochrome c-type biogenesis protein CcsB
MITLSQYSILAALFLYMACCVGALMDAVSHSDRWHKVAVVSGWAGLASGVVGLGAIVVELGRAPWGSLYEWTTSVSVVIMLVLLIMVLPKRNMAGLASFITGGTIALMVAGLALYTPPGPLVPALQSNWLTFHVALAVGGSALLLMGGVASALYLVRVHGEKKAGVVPAPAQARTAARRAARTPQPELVTVGAPASGTLLDGEPVVEPSDTVTSDTVTHDVPPADTPPPKVRGFAGFLPDSDSLDNFARTVFTLAFPIYTLAIFAGAVWGEQAWSRYWGWDPKETASFITWILFAGYLHARSTRDWKGVKAAWLGVVGALVVVFNTFVVNLFIAGLHSYAGV